MAKKRPANSSSQKFLDGFEPEKPLLNSPEPTATTAPPPGQFSITPPAQLAANPGNVLFEHTTSDIPDDLSGQTVVLVDSHSLIYQIFHAMPPMSSPNGTPVSVVHGFLRDILDLRDRWQPAFIWCAFDLSEITFRNELYEPYKAHRDPMPDELRTQIPLVRQVLQALGAGIAEAPGYEADDVLATLARQVESRGGLAIVVTNDKDCRQLLSDHVKLFNIRKNEVFEEPELRAAWGIAPAQVVDFQALVGDSVDNVPGVPLIGPKFAQQLLEQYGNLDTVLENAAQVNGKKRAENLREFRDQALLSRELVRLRVDVSLEIDWRNANFSRRRPRDLKHLFDDFGFRRLADRVLADDQSIPALQTASATQYTLVASIEHLQQLSTEHLESAALLSIDTETTSTNARAAELVGISISWKPRQAVYIPIRCPATEAQLALDDVIRVLRPSFENPAIRKIGQNIKYDLIVLRGHGLDVKGVMFDTMVADYLIDPGQRDHSLDGLAERHLSFQTIKIRDLIGTGREQLCMSQVPLSQIVPYACQDADLPLQLFPLLDEKIQLQGLRALYDDLEIPLLHVLSDMEYLGIRVDTDRLSKLALEFETRIESIRESIFRIAGTEFNLDSPKQLATILYDQLKLPIVKKTRTGPSTDAEVLSQLSAYHALPVQLLEYRQLAKLKGTYVDALPQLVCPKTNRIHTSFRQDVAATGRLSSADPNLQNIPVRTQEGRQIRAAFTADPPEWHLVAADYSQIELRVLAHFCQDSNLTHAFLQDRDIHAQVASEVYGVPLDQVSAAQRRSAKAINFGIIYGQSPFGLAKSLQISKGEAAEFITAYFNRLPGVKQLIEDTIMTCRRQGFVSTLLNRKRYIQGVRDFSQLSESRKQVLIEPERIAVNTVIQGSAADLIKLAMLAVQKAIRASKLQASMLLQIHDELIFEVAPQDCPELIELVRSAMTNVMSLQVPLKVDVKTGPTWADCEPVL
ncbi:MAG: DNA polymerase I [Planctomycetales bacterium]|nr:DNA polymerase I [Planctomycetales bacterium]